ncbi:MAG TPA: hypothetical protein VLT87_06560 [Thermoanaerobaculia bacterium]|nr:hypothetical protein [Thermoanaerobaculia bacterium]
MTITLELSKDLERELSAEAEKLGLPLSEYALRLLSTGRGPWSAPKNGAELVAYWQSEGVIGSRSDIEDSQAHAQEIRRKAETRERS